MHLDDGEIAVVRADGYEDLDARRRRDPQDASHDQLDERSARQGPTRALHAKEIAEQPEAVRRTLGGRLEQRFQTTPSGGLEAAARELLEVRRVKILGCGSAYIAGSSARSSSSSLRACRRMRSPRPSSATAIP